jgi:hypothetical protein
MDIQRMVDKAATGLLKMDNNPDYLLFMGYYITDDSVWDVPYISSIPVIYTDAVIHSTDDIDCPFYPFWNQGEGHYVDVALFRIGYDGV